MFAILGLKPRLCYDPMTIAVVVMAAGTAYQGFAANQSAKAQAGLMEEQARIAQQESEVAAGQKETERRKFLAEQRMAYLASGVNLSGTPGIVGEETSKEFQLEIDALRRSGAAQYGLGMKSAANTKANGRAQLTGSLLQAGGTLAMGASKGAFGTTAKTTTTSNSFSSSSLSKGLIYGS